MTGLAFCTAEFVRIERLFEAFTCAPAAAALTLASGGTPKDALIAFAISFAQMGVYDAVGGIVRAAGGGIAGLATKVATHAIVGGAFSVAQGGSFSNGAVTGAIAGATSFVMGATPLGKVPGAEGVLVRTAIASAVGGTASVLSGGEFANGAITGAMGHLFNQEQLFTNQFSKWGDVLAGTERAGKDLGNAAVKAEMVVGTFAVGGAFGELLAAETLFGLGGYTFSRTVAAQLAQRPYVTSGLLIDEIVTAGTVSADVVPGFLKYTAPGTLWLSSWGSETAASRGAYEIVINPKTRTVVHFLFKASK